MAKLCEADLYFSESFSHLITSFFFIQKQNLIDWIQERWLQCCGIEGPRDWDKNVYFNCNSTAREACGVPFSCCKQQSEVESLLTKIQKCLAAKR